MSDQDRDRTATPQSTPTTPATTPAPQVLPYQLQLLCWPRATFMVVPAVLLLVLSLLGMAGWMPASVPAVTVHILVVGFVLVREFDFKDWNGVGIAALAVGVTGVIVVWMKWMPEFQWFSGSPFLGSDNDPKAIDLGSIRSRSTAAVCALTGALLLTTVIVHLIVATKIVTIEKSGINWTVYGKSLNGDRIEFHIPKDAKVLGQERDVVESILTTLRLRPIGDIVITAKEGEIIGVIDGVTNADTVAKTIKAMTAG